MTTSEWEKYGWGPWPADEYVPHAPPDAETERRLKLPPTLRPVPGARQSPVFDPALKQHAKAMRAGEPRFASSAVERRWYAARRHAIDRVLAAVERSPWADHLVLRGSVPLRAWYGDLAREPGDLDFIVTTDADPEQIMNDLARAAAALPGDTVVPLADEAVLSDIWTYDRVPGRRLLLPWWGVDAPSGTVQLDFTFGETLPAEPATTEIPSVAGPPARVRAATPEMSLAWKIVWLLDDAHPQGKDLYDAWLLATHCRSSYRLLMKALVLAQPSHASRPLNAERLAGLKVDWKEFRKDYPDAPTEPDDHLHALIEALAPTLAEAADLPSSGYERTALLLEPQTTAYRAVQSSHDRDEVVRRLANVPLPEAVVIVRELDGRTEDIDTIATSLLQAWGRQSKYGQAGYYRRNPDRVTTDLDPLRT